MSTYVCGVSQEVELRFCPWAHIVQTLNRVAWPELFSSPDMCMHRGSRPKVSLSWQDLRFNTRTSYTKWLKIMHQTAGWEVRSPRTQWAQAKKGDGQWHFVEDPVSLSLSNSMAHSHLIRFVTNGINDMQVLPNLDFVLGKREVFYRRTRCTVLGVLCRWE